MKTNEFITEASVMSKPIGYSLLLSDSKDGQKWKSAFIDAGIDPSQFTIASFGPKKQGPVITLNTKDQNSMVVIADGKGKKFTIVGSKAGIEGIFVNPTANKGEVAEGILGAAMFAKFVARNRGGIGTVTVDDVWGVLYNLKKTGDDQYSISVQDSNKKIADQVTFVLRLKSAPYAAVTDPKQQPNYIDIAQSTVAYINSSHAERYSQYFYTNGKADTIRVVSDGVSDESGRKTDIELEIYDHKSGKMKRGKLSISLKVGPVKQFGQVGGIEFKSMLKLWGYFGINVSNLKTYYEDMASTDPEGALRTMYSKIADYIAKTVDGDSSVEEYDLIKNVVKAINYFATLNDPTVSIVQLTSKGQYKILRFRNIEPKLRQMNLSAEYDSGKTMPEITIYDRESKKVLITVRAKNEFKEDGSSYVRNIIEKGPLLDLVASASK